MMEKNKKNNKILYDQKINNKDISEGDKVLLRNETGHKLDYEYNGPYKVTKIGDRKNIVITYKNKQLIRIDKNVYFIIVPSMAMLI